MDQSILNLAQEFWYFLDLSRPDLTRSAPVPGRMRGIDYYKGPNFFPVLANALTTFYQAQGRTPDLRNLPQSCDHFFAMKFFEAIPISPNPSSKLNAALFLGSGFTDRIRVPKRYAIASKPVLPADDDVPAGSYWLKLDLGNATQTKVVWPPSPAERQDLEALARKWFSSRYGPSWGEWWYGVGDQRIFLEEDLTEDMGDGFEMKLWVRNARPSWHYKIKYPMVTGKKVVFLRYFDEQGDPVEGAAAYGVKGEKFRSDLDVPAFAGMETIREAASHIGRHFRLARVDFYVPSAGKPILGEITFCQSNARLVHVPSSLEEGLTKALFG